MIKVLVLLLGVLLLCSLSEAVHSRRSRRRRNKAKRDSGHSQSAVADVKARISKIKTLIGAIHQEKLSKEKKHQTKKQKKAEKKAAAEAEAAKPVDKQSFLDAEAVKGYKQQLVGMLGDDIKYEIDEKYAEDHKAISKQLDEKEIKQALATQARQKVFKAQAILAEKMRNGPVAYPQAEKAAEDDDDSEDRDMTEDEEYGFGDDDYYQGAYLQLANSDYYNPYMYSDDYNYGGSYMSSGGSAYYDDDFSNYQPAMLQRGRPQRGAGGRGAGPARGGMAPRGGNGGYDDYSYDDSMYYDDSGYDSYDSSSYGAGLPENYDDYYSGGGYGGQVLIEEAKAKKASKVEESMQKEIAPGIGHCAMGFGPIGDCAYVPVSDCETSGTYSSTIETASIYSLCSWDEDDHKCKSTELGGVCGILNT